jgi:hypothetical protein
VIAVIVAPNRFEQGQTLLKTNPTPSISFINAEISALKAATNSIDQNASTFRADYHQALKMNEGLTYYGLSTLFTFEYVLADLSVNWTVPLAVASWNLHINLVCDALIENQLTLISLSPDNPNDDLQFYSKRLTAFKQATQEVQAALLLLYNDAAFLPTELTAKLHQVAPAFNSADSILSFVSIAPLLTNIASAWFCLGCSAIFHLYYVKSPFFSDVLSRLDYGGISVLIFGSSFPIIYYSFACQPENLQRWIWVGLIAALAIGCFISTLIKKFD